MYLNFYLRKVCIIILPAVRGAINLNIRSKFIQ